MEPTLVDQLAPLVKDVIDGSDGTSPVLWALVTLVASKAWTRLYTGLKEVLELFKKGVGLLEKLVAGDISLAVRLHEPVLVKSVSEHNAAEDDTQGYAPVSD